VLDLFYNRTITVMTAITWVPGNTAWRVLRLHMEERPPTWRVAVNKLNRQPGTADKGWPSSFGVGLGANNPSP
jgi:predicted lysophospholipase L1 biosynthesis ABC-type transport system permease subunit